MRFLRFYWKLFDQALTDWQAIHDKVILIGALVLSLSAFLSKTLAVMILNRTQGISPRWGFLPLVLLVVYRLMRTNYEEYSKMEAGLSEFQLKESKRKGSEKIYGQLALVLLDGDRLSETRVKNEEELLKLAHRFGRWQALVQASLAVATSEITDAVLFASTPTRRIEEVQHALLGGSPIAVQHAHLIRELDDNRANLRQVIERYLRKKTDLAGLEILIALREKLWLRKADEDSAVQDA